MYKIGTGQNGTTAGQVYLYKQLNKNEEISWVYLKGKLYLRNHPVEVE